MRLQVRYPDAHKGFIPVPRVRTRVVLYDDTHPEPPEPRSFEQGPAPLPHTRYESGPEPAFEHPMTIKEYDWESRKAIAMQNMPNVANWVYPIGYVEPYRPTGHTGDEKRELAWLMKTQDMEIPPQWAELAANGIEAGSLTDSENGVAEDIDEGSTDLSLALAQIYESGRREEWTKMRDMQTYLSSPCRTARIFVNEEGKRTIQATNGSRWSRDELLALLRRPASAPNTEAWDADRPEFEIADQEARLEPETYGNTEPCPMATMRFYYDANAEAVEACKNGKSPVIEQDKSGYYIDEWVDCPTCGGTGNVLSLLGISMSIVDGEEFDI